jgi:two-component sensor histidine kinase
MAVCLREGRSIRGAEAIAERPDGSRVSFIPYPTPLRNAQGEIVGAINMLVDISDRKEAETRQRVLIDELNHRVKNTLATVQSLAHQTARHATTLDAFVETFEGRVLALAKVHDLLTKRHWLNAPLKSLIEDILAPHAEGEARTRISGPAAELKPAAALSLTMALNELTTNAAKYGALSRDTGVLSVQWELHEDRVLRLEWTEQGGPAVLTPHRLGFGTRLMQRCIERDLDGHFDLQFQPSGLRCYMTIPLGERAHHV